MAERCRPRVTEGLVVEGSRLAGADAEQCSFTRIGRDRSSENERSLGVARTVRLRRPYSNEEDRCDERDPEDEDRRPHTASSIPQTMATLPINNGRWRLKMSVADRTEGEPTYDSNYLRGHPAPRTSLRPFRTGRGVPKGNP